jgi:hypothetical protein
VLAYASKSKNAKVTLVYRLPELPNVPGKSIKGMNAAVASDAIGRRALVHRPRANQHEVFALTRSPDSVPLKEIGAEPVIPHALKAAA